MSQENKCKSDFDTNSLVLRDVKHCSNIFITKTDVVEIEKVPVVFTTRYRLCTRPTGFGLGKHLYTLSLVPSEEVEIAISHRSKLETGTHQMMSIEQEFSNSFSDTFRQEHSQKETSDFEFTAEENVKFGFWIFNSGGVKSTQEYKTHEEEYTKTVRDTIIKASSRVDQKFEVVIDMKSEVESASAVKRKVKNPNPCYTVTYNYFQLLRIYQADLILIDVRFDMYPAKDFAVAAIVRSEPYTVRIPKAIFVTAPAPQTIYKAAGVSVTTEQATAPLVTPSGKPIMLLDKSRFRTLADKAIPAQDLEKFNSELEKFLQGFKVGSVIKTYEYTIATNGVYVDSLLGQCSACEDYVEEKNKLELALMQADLELKKQQLEGKEEPPAE